MSVKNKVFLKTFKLETAGAVYERNCSRLYLRPANGHNEMLPSLVKIE